MVNIYYEKDGSLKKIRDKKIAIVGYGNQGHAHADNLKESGLNVIVGLPEWDKVLREKAKNVGHTIKNISDASKEADIIMMLIPDEIQPSVYKKEIEVNLSAGKYLAFAHGSNIHFNQIQAPENVNVFMVAPKGPGNLVRQEYAEGRGVPALIAVQQDPSKNTKDIALAYAIGIGAGRAGIIETTFKDETETDLFGEQSVLCGGITALMTAGFETLVSAGYPPELAYFECINEMKLIVDLIYAGGITAMRRAISNTARFGDITRGPRIINEGVCNEMKKILQEIQSGSFAKEWILETASGKPVFNSLTKKGDEHLLETTGKKLRSMMPWMVKKEK